MHLQKTIAFGLFSFYIAFLILLPGGTVFGVNVKALVFIPVAALAVQRLFEEKDALFQLAIGIGLFAIFIC